MIRATNFTLILASITLIVCVFLMTECEKHEANCKYQQTCGDK